MSRPDRHQTRPQPAAELGDVADSVSVRRALRPVADGRLDADHLARFEVAVAEVVTNALVHGRGRVDVRLWTLGDSVVVEVDDEGAGPPDPGVGTTAPDVSTPGGFGLWIARQWSDELDIERGREGGCTVRLTAGPPASGAQPPS